MIFQLEVSHFLDSLKLVIGSTMGEYSSGSPQENSFAVIITKLRVDLFAGCGGLSLGLEQAGFKPLLVSELNEDARKTYMANRKSLPVNLSKKETFTISTTVA